MATAQKGQGWSQGYLYSGEYKKINSGTCTQQKPQFAPDVAPDFAPDFGSELCILYIFPGVGGLGELRVKVNCAFDELGIKMMSCVFKK